MQTTIFRPNVVERDWMPAWITNNRTAAVCGGCSRQVISGDILNYKSNAGSSEDTIWHGDIREAILVAARWQDNPDGNYHIRARAMMRFILRDVTIQASTIVSGNAPQTSWWPNVVAARLKWFNGDQLGLQPIPTLVSESDLHIRVGRDLYVETSPGTPTIEQPFGGPPGSEIQPTFNNGATFGSAEVTLPWATWNPSDRTPITHNLSSAAINAYLKTITGSTNDFIEFSFRLDKENVDGVNIARAIGAWDPHPPTLEIDFNV